VAATTDVKKRRSSQSQQSVARNEMVKSKKSWKSTMCLCFNHTLAVHKLDMRADFFPLNSLSVSEDFINLLKVSRLFLSCGLWKLRASNLSYRSSISFLFIRPPR